MTTRFLLLASAAFLPANAFAQDVADGDKKEEKWDVMAPHGPGQQVPIDTRTGTWMSLDVSPNGQEIVFDMLGDIYLLPISGGEATPIATGNQWDMQPVFSPDGSEIAFTSDRGGGDNLWVMKRDGSKPRQLSGEKFRLLNQPEWTPDGEYVVGRKHFTSSRSLGAGEMWLFHKSGKSGGVQMTKARTKQKDTGEPAFSPDGKYLYYSDDSTPGETFEYSKDVNGQIYTIKRLDRETGDVETIVSGAGGAIRPTPSPDGKSLAFVRRVRAKSVLMLMDLESGRITPLTDMLDRDMQETWAIHGVYPHMDWTPDGKSIIFWAKGGIHRIDVASKAVSDIPFHVSGTRFVADAVRQQKQVAPDSFQTKALRNVAVSPDGRRVAFEALGKIWVRDLAGGAPRALTAPTNVMQLEPAWSRDGSQIAWVEWDDQDLGSIKVARADGSRARTVTRAPGHYVEPAFSPDGRLIAYRKTGGGYLTSPLYSRDQGIYVAPVAGGEPKLVTEDGSEPQFGASNDRLYYLGSDGDNAALKSIDIDGTDGFTHLTSENAGGFSVSPTEGLVAWTERFQAYVIPLVRTGRTIEVGPDGEGLPQAKVTKDVGDYVQWSGDGKTLYWAEGPTLYRRTIAAPGDLKEGEASEVANLAITVDYAKPTGTYVLSGARIITMNGDEVIENGAIMVSGDRITAVGPLAAMSWPADTRVIDVSGKTIMPGMIDAHWHGGMASDGIIPQQNWVHAAGLAYGVTTVHDPSNDSHSIFAASEYQKAGRILAPRIFSTGTILYGATTHFTAKIESLDDALSHLRRLQSLGAWSVKSYNQPRRDQRQMVIEAARQLGMEVVPEGGSLFMHNMTMIADGHTTIEHSLPVANVYDDVLQFWGGKQDSVTAYTPTLVVSYGGPFGEMWWYQTTNVWEEPILSKWVPRPFIDASSRRPVKYPEEENNLKAVSASTKRINDAGIDVNIGAHGQREGLGAHWDIWSFALGGMSNLNALKAATINPARSLGLDQDLGSIEAGKLADLVVMDANPLENIRNSTSVSMVMIGGRLLDSDLTTIAGGTGKLDPFWFQEHAGGDYTAGASESVPHRD